MPNNGVLTPNLLNIPFASCFLFIVDFLLPLIAHFDNSIILPLLVFKVLGFMFLVFFYTFNNKMTLFYIHDFKHKYVVVNNLLIICFNKFIAFNNLTDAYFLTFSIRLIFSVSPF